MSVVPAGSSPPQDPYLVPPSVHDSSHGCDVAECNAAGAEPMRRTAVRSEHPAFNLPMAATSNSSLRAYRLKQPSWLHHGDRHYILYIRPLQALIALISSISSVMSINVAPVKCSRTYLETRLPSHLVHKRNTDLLVALSSPHFLPSNIQCSSTRAGPVADPLLNAPQKECAGPHAWDHSARGKESHLISHGKSRHWNRRDRWHVRKPFDIPSR